MPGNHNFDLFLITACLLMQQQVVADTGPEQWWPSPWGTQDQAGASNHINPETVLKATRLIRSGEIIELGRVYEQGMPLKFDRIYAQRTSPPEGPYGDKKMVISTETLCTEVGHVGTQVDGLAHAALQTGPSSDDIYLYNGVPYKDVISTHGFKKLGIENMKPLFTRAVLIDVAKSKGRMLEGDEEITLADVKEALQQQNMTLTDIRKGDVVLFNTGWGSLWMVDNEKYNSPPPGIGLEVARWLVSRNIVLVGADTWQTSTFPSLTPDDYTVHSELLTRNGIYIQENLNLEELSQKNIYEFAYVFNRVPMKGATGSLGSPLAIH